ncbi:CIA30 family protein [Leptolyngbya ohadii]|uniref:CIA30 family protein n=1 Tax=Leptolyngbya ohadii TaxID=1962290 RepID=UPI001CED84C5|nr:CIA30 family protein [Leptolyngbya ohadii]
MTRQSSNWDLGRFVKTLSYFGAVPILSQMDWFQQWFGSRPDPTVDSRSLNLAASPSSPPSAASNVAAMPQTTQTQTTLPQTILIVGTGDLLTALVDCLQAQGKPIRAASLDLSYQPDRSGVEWVKLDLQQAPPAELLAGVGTIVCAMGNHSPFGTIESESLVEPTGRFLIEAAEQQDSRLPIFDFSHQSINLSEIWGALDDVVMGGVSQSGIRLNGNFAEFSGQVSTANSGGFASVRTRNLEPPIDLSEYDGIELRLKGDGNRYKFMLRGETNWDGVAHCASFDTVRDRWITVRFPFASLIPVFRARTLENVPLKPDRIRAFQLMLSKFEYDGALNPHFQPGFFQLQVESISAYKQSDRIPLILVSSAADSKAELLLKQSQFSVRVLRPAEGEAAGEVVEEVVQLIG